MHTTEPCEHIQGLPLRLIAALISLCLLCLGACGTETASNQNADNVWSSDASTQRSAPSLSASIQSFLEEPMGDAQRTALERALGHDGKVSRTDYMAAWSNYRQCMVDKGYNEPPLHMVNGLVVELMHFDFSGMSDQQQMKFHQDQSACLEQESLYVASAYSDSIVNPELYVDLDVAMVDCLRRHELVPVEYTVAQYRKESKQFTDMTFDGENLTQQQSYERRRKAYSFDFSDPQVRTCVAGVNASAIADELEPWKPL